MVRLFSLYEKRSYFVIFYLFFRLRLILIINNWVVRLKIFKKKGVPVLFSKKESRKKKLLKTVDKQKKM